MRPHIRNAGVTRRHDAIKAHPTVYDMIYRPPYPVYRLLCNMHEILIPPTASLHACFCRRYDARADLWSTGVILHEALYGHAPFHSRTNDELVAKITSDDNIELPPAPELSPACADLLRGLLQRNPQQRMTFEAFFAHEVLPMSYRRLDDG